MKKVFKFIAEIIVVFFLVNIAQDIIIWTIHKIQEPYRVQLEEAEKQLEEINIILETEMPEN